MLLDPLSYHFLTFPLPPWLQVAWAPGRGVKDKVYKEYWDVESGVSYLPHPVVLSAGGSAQSLSDGGWVDPSTVPTKLADNSVEMTIVDN